MKLVLPHLPHLRLIYPHSHCDSDRSCESSKSENRRKSKRKKRGIRKLAQIGVFIEANNSSSSLSTLSYCSTSTCVSADTDCRKNTTTAAAEEEEEEERSQRESKGDLREKSAHSDRFLTHFLHAHVYSHLHLNLHLHKHKARVKCQEQASTDETMRKDNTEGRSLAGNEGRRRKNSLPHSFNFSDFQFNCLNKQAADAKPLQGMNSNAIEKEKEEVRSLLLENLELEHPQWWNVADQSKDSQSLCADFDIDLSCCTLE